MAAPVSKSSTRARQSSANPLTALLNNVEKKKRLTGNAGKNSENPPAPARFIGSKADRFMPSPRTPGAADRAAYDRAKSTMPRSENRFGLDYRKARQAAAIRRGGAESTRALTALRVMGSAARVAAKAVPVASVVATGYEVANTLGGSPVKDAKKFKKYKGLPDGSPFRAPGGIK